MKIRDWGFEEWALVVQVSCNTIAFAAIIFLVWMVIQCQ